MLLSSVVLWNEPVNVPACSYENARAQEDHENQAFKTYRNARVQVILRGQEFKKYFWRTQDLKNDSDKNAKAQEIQLMLVRIFESRVTSCQNRTY
jgi:hypothetical protein